MCSIIIVDYNSIEKTVDFIEHISTKIVGIESFNFVVVDNYSMNNGKQYLDKKYGKCEMKNLNESAKVYIYHVFFGNIVYCFSGENLGYAKGNNLGVDIANKLYMNEYYIICNNDLRLNADLEWKKIKEIFEKDSSIAVVGPRIIGLDGKKQSPHKRIGCAKHLIGSYWLQRFPLIWKNGDKDICDYSKKCFRVMGCFMIIKADIFNKVGKFDPNTFMFAEEMILGEKLSKHGYSCYYYNEYTIIHEHSASVKKNVSRLEADRWAFESCYYYYKEYRNASCVILFLSQISFFLYKLRVYMKEILRSVYYLIIPNSSK